MPKNLSDCHGVPVVRWTTHGHPVCSQCGARCGPPKKKQPQPPPAKPPEARWIDDGKTSFEPDTRNFIRHLSNPDKFAECRRSGFRTTDLSRVNCALCMRSERYKELLRKKAEAQTI